MDNSSLKVFYERVVSLRKSKANSKNQSRNEFAEEVFHLYDTFENTMSCINTICENIHSEIQTSVQKEKTCNVLPIGKDGATKIVHIKSAGDNVLRSLIDTKLLESTVPIFTNVNLEGLDQIFGKTLDFDGNISKYVNTSRNMLKIFKVIKMSAENMQRYKPEDEVSSASTDVSQWPSFSPNNGLITSSPRNGD